MQFAPHRRPNTSDSIKAFLKEISIAFIIVLFVTVYPKIVYAGLFSFITDLAPAQASAQDKPGQSYIDPVVSNQSSQSTNILSAAINPDPNPDNTATTELPVLDNAIIPAAEPLVISTSSYTFTNTQISTYVVHQGDTLSQIAKIFGVSVNTIIWANDLPSNPTLSAGQTLVILPVSGLNYSFKKGDTLQGVVKKFNADLNEVLQYNDITADSVISIGSTIIIPDATLDGATVASIVQTPKTVGRYTGHGIPPRSLWGVKGENPAHDTNGPNLGNYFLRPIAHGVVSQGLHGYNAVDLAAPIGTPILASADGVVIISKVGGWNGGYGNYMVINHPNGTQTLYAHASKNYATVGQKVSRGDIIGLVGKTGEATGPHLHYEIHGAADPFWTPVYF